MGYSDRPARYGIPRNSRPAGETSSARRNASAASSRRLLGGAVRAKLTLAEREFVCENCGTRLDRDRGAARNLAALSACPLTPHRCPGSIARGETPR